MEADVAKLKTKAAKERKGSAPAKEPKKVAVKLIEGDGGSAYLDITDSPENLKSAIFHLLSNTIGWNTARDANHVYEIDMLAGLQTSIESNLDDCGVSTTSLPVKTIFKHIATHVETMKDRIADKLSRGVIEFADIPYVFVKGTEVLTIHAGEPVGGRIESVELHTTFFGRYYEVKIKTISNISGDVAEHDYTTSIGAWRGQVDLSSLHVRMITDHDKAFLTERGKTFRDYATGPNYVHYTGQLVRSSWWSSYSYRADGRVVIDNSTFQQIDSDQFENETRNSRLDVQDRYSRQEGVRRPHFELSDNELWRTYPFLYGFSFKAKQWGRMSVTGLKPIKWRDDAWDKLVLPADEKELVRAIVEHQGDSFTDIVDEKGGGSIFLLHGPPGQGKTLTAETIAEVLRRPLYAISVGELGVSPDELENKLREILDVATVWNAVLLLDEADIFLEARDEKDIVRNAMVGVFLRLLEYHQGVLFLTTNRVRNIDEAFYSRISIGLEFGAADSEKRAKVWTNLLDAAGLKDLDIPQLAAHDLNGRQIKNIIRLSQTLAKAKGEEVNMAGLERVISLTGKFKK